MSWPVAVLFAILEVGWLIASILLVRPMWHIRVGLWQHSAPYIRRALVVTAGFFSVMALRSAADPSFGGGDSSVKWWMLGLAVYSLTLLVTSVWWLPALARAKARRGP